MTTDRERKKNLLLLSAALWLLDAVFYLLSFIWPEMYRWSLLFYLPLFLGVVYPFFVMGQQMRSNPQNLVKGLGRKENRWLLILLVVSVLITIISFFWNGLAVLGQGSGELIDGVFWRADHGNLIERITEAEYLRLRAAETRLGLGHLFVFLALPTVCFGRKKAE